MAKTFALTDLDKLFFNGYIGAKSLKYGSFVTFDPYLHVKCCSTSQYFFILFLFSIRSVRALTVNQRKLRIAEILLSIFSKELQLILVSLYDWVHSPLYLMSHKTCCALNSNILSIITLTFDSLQLAENFVEGHFGLFCYTLAMY